MKSITLLTAGLATASAAQWSNHADVASATVGVGAGSAEVAFVAAGSNGKYLGFVYLLCLCGRERSRFFFYEKFCSV